ncbi:MAG: hypothetical protein AAFQ64_08555 [Pseudomonadota bacterium]
MALIGLLGLAACGGGGSTASNEAGQMAGDPQSPPGNPTGTSFTDTLQLTSDERLTLVSTIPSAATAFNAANAGAVFTDFPISGFASYDGSLVMRMGDGRGFLLGSLDLNFNFANGGSGTGFLSNLVIDGDPFEDFIVTQGVLNVDIPDLTAPEFTGRILGEFNEIGNINSSADTHNLDAALTGSFVQPSGLSSEPEIVGNVEGTLDSAIDGTRSVEGIFVAERGL